MKLLWTLAALVAALGLLQLFSLWWTRRRITQALSQVLPSPERRALGLSARVFVNHSVPGGPRANVINSGAAGIALGAGVVAVATHHGRVLIIDAQRPGALRSPGPRRLVLEGQHPMTATPTRVELIIEGAEEWATAAGQAGIPT
jgi:hypothetical protein